MTRVDPGLGCLNPQAGKKSKKQTSSESVFVLLLARCYKDASNKEAREYKADLRVLLAMENTTVLRLSYHFILLYLSADRSVKISPVIKPVRGVKKGNK